jgi:cyclopropane fatty-acyl-phospholipid synthase-like methyltransferase
MALNGVVYQPFKDPYSLAFRDEQMGLYCRLAGVASYDTANERSHFEMGEAVCRPFPYHTGSSQTVGDALMGIGFLLKTADLRPESRVLEFGRGWGNTTFGSRTPRRVTAVDIESNFVDLIRHRVTAVGLDVESIQGEFNVFFDSNRRFDTVVFFESFHHHPTKTHHRADKVRFLVGQFKPAEAP